MSSIVNQAREFARAAHGDQKYGDKAYVYHLEQVVSRLMHWKQFSKYEITDEILATAWLHDVLEDTVTKKSDLIIPFGKQVADDVEALTKDKIVAYDEYITYIKMSGSATIVKMADTLCNLDESVLINDTYRIRKYAKQLLKITE